ncbi:hypothetical protein [Novosphingobium lentum]|uniref:hypothetical protein n=1 Tax=Novosphingobium lentum TaxID=145287 RepID=UPI000829BE65|nr:hypothetical protein [Novosphingobium lentum]
MTEPEDPAWFAPKRFGYGSGLPIVWQGWAVLGAHTALILLVFLNLRAYPLPCTLATGAVALAAVPLYKARTLGGWRWRWGKDD